MSGPFGFEVWRQRRDDLLREAERARLVKAASREKERSLFRGLLQGLSAVLASPLQPEAHGVVPGPAPVAEVRTVSGRSRRCRSKAA